MIYIDYGILDLYSSDFPSRKLIYKGSVMLSDKILCPNSFNLTYPIICNMKDSKLETKLNEILKNFLSSFIMKQISVSVDSINPNTLKGTYKLCLNENNLLSIIYEFYSCTNNETNGIITFNSLTLNTLTGKVYSFKDIFKINSNYKEILNKIIEKQIKNKSIELIREFEGVKDSQSFYLTPNDLVIYYQTQDYTYYSYGLLIFKIPYKEIDDILNPQLPIKIYFFHELNSKYESEDNIANIQNIALHLFKKAINELGACSPENAIELWAEGIKTRNGALQYSVLNRDLKFKLERCLNNTSWITGNSSPWVENYKIIKSKKIDSITYKAIISFHLVGDKLDAGYVDAILTIEKKGKFWVITNIK